MLHKISDFCNKIDSIKKKSDELRVMKYGNPKASEEEINNTILIKGDFTTTDSQKKIKGFFKSKVDVVVSDMAVNTTGIKDIDAIYTGELAMEAMNFSKEILVKEGRFVSKIFLGSSFNEIVALGKKIFKEVKVFKPKSSRKESKESFIICKILR